MVRLSLAVFTLNATLASQAASGGLQLDGSNAYVAFGPAPQLGLSTFTIETWFKRTRAGVAANTGSGGLTAVPLVTKGRGEADGSNVDMNWFLGINSADLLAADFEDAATGLNHPVAGITPLALDAWYHAAVTFDGATKTLKLYLNGLLEKELYVGQLPRADSIQHAALGSALNSTGAKEGAFAGILDEVRIWNVARSQQEIQSSMYQQIASAQNLAGRWALDETEGTVAADSSGNNVNGILMGGPVWVTGYSFVPSPAVQLTLPVNGYLSTNRNVTFTVTARDAVNLVSATLTVAPLPAPQTLVLSGAAETMETELRATTPDANYGGDTSLNVDNDNPVAHGLVKFPNLFGAGRIPSGAHIVSATLKVNCSNLGAMLQIYRLVEDWNENEAAWNHRMNGVAWAVAGAEGASHAATALNGDCTATGWRSIDLTTFVQEWSDGLPNYGIVMIGTGTDGVDFYTSESTTPPELTVVYQVTSGVPINQTKAISGTNAQVTFDPITLDDGQSYQWNCQVQNSGGETAWAPVSFTLYVDANYPDFPILISPPNNATEVTLNPDLAVTVSDPTPGDTLTVEFFGRAAQSDDPDFTVVVLPDTQNYSESYPFIFTAQTSWIRNEVLGANPRNIVMVAHEGDVVNVANTTQYANANASLSLLDSVVPYGLLRGNHDSSAALFNQYFPYTRYAGNAWYGGHYPANANDNNYQKVTVGSQKILLLNLSYMPAADVITWADGVIKAHADHKVIIVTHAYLYVDGSYIEPSHSNIWNGLVVPNANVVMVLCGHEHNEFTRIDATPDGRLIPQLLADYQNDANGGNGLLRLLRFSPAQNKVYVQTYSPYLNQFETDADSEFTVDAPLNAYQAIATQTGVASGATVSAAWADRAANRQYEWYVKVTDATGRATRSPIWSFTTGNGTPVGPMPLANSQAVPAFDEDPIAPVTLMLTGDDGSETENLPLTYTILTTPQHGTLNGTAPNLAYTPALNYNGSDSFTFKVNNGFHDSAPGTVSLTINPVNDTPTAAGQAVTTPEDVPLVVTLTGIDPDNDPLTSAIVGGPQNGELVVIDSALYYVPADNYFGPDSFTFKVNDGIVDSEIATVTITVTAVNDPPAAIPQTLTTPEDAPLTIALSGTDVDSGSLSSSIATQPVNGSLAASGNNWIYTPNANYQGPDSFTFTVNDGLANSAPATVVITVTPVNDAPMAANQLVGTDVSTPLNISLNYSDLDGDTLNCSVTAAPALGTLSGTAPNLTYTPGGAAGTDSFTYIVTDGNGGAASATVTIEVTALAPVRSYASGETAVMSTLVGTWRDTLAKDSTTEQLTEKLSSGKPSLRYSTLEHIWTLNAAPGKGVTFFVNAWRSANNEGDNFTFAYSTDRTNYQTMLTVSANSGSGYQSFALPPTLSGAVYVRVQDTDHTAGNMVLDTLFVDHLYIETDVTPVTDPPGAPELQSAVAGNAIVTLTWAASAGADSYKVWRRIGTDAFAVVALGITGTTYVDSTVLNGTTYEYYVTAVNAYGDSQPSNLLAATPQAPVAIEPPTNLVAAGIKRKINLSWTQSVTAGVTANKIYRSTDGGAFTLLTTIPAGTSYNDAVASGTTCYYYVTAVGSAGESTPSNTASATAK